MKALKYLGLGIGGLIVLAFVIGFFLPQHIHVERSAVIGMDQSTMYAYLQNPKNFMDWSPWNEVDPSIEVKYFGPETGVGAGYSWTSEDPMVGEGTWTIARSEPMSKIEVDIKFGEDGGGLSTYKLEPSGEGTKITWMMDSDMGFWPIGRYFGLMIESSLPPMYERGLVLLDSVVAAMPRGTVDKIEEQTTPGFAMLSMREKVSTDNIGDMLGRSYGAIVSYVNEKGLQMSAPPFAIYHYWPMSGKGEADVEAAIPIAEPEAGNDVVNGTIFPGGNIVVAYFYGPFEATEQAHTALHKWAEENGKTLGEVPWEVYVTDPQNEPDPAKWLTLVCYRVAAPDVDA